jgi:hypothetical protein
LAKLGQGKSGRVQATLTASKCAQFSCVGAFNFSQISLVFKSEKCLQLALKLKVMASYGKNVQKIYLKPFVLQKPTAIKIIFDNSLFEAVFYKILYIYGKVESCFLVFVKLVWNYGNGNR